MKRFFTLAVMFVVLFCVASQKEAAYFSDVQEDAYYYDAVNRLYEREVISGKGNGKFAPNDPVTRGQAAKMIANAIGIEPSAANVSFRDVPKTNSLYPYIAALVELDILNGYSDGNFKPNAKITRNQMAKIIARAYVLHTDKVKELEHLPYRDVSTSSSYYDDIRALNYHGVASSQPKYNGGNSVSRGQIATFIVRAEDTILHATGYIHNYNDVYVETSQGLLKYDEQGLDVPLPETKKGELYEFSYSNRTVFRLNNLEEEITSELPEEENDRTDEEQSTVTDEDEQTSTDEDNSFEVTDSKNFLRIHSSNIGLYEIYDVKAKSKETMIQVEDRRNNIYFEVTDPYEGLSEWFTIRGETYLYDHRIEIDVELFYEDGELQYDFHFNPDRYTLQAKDFISEKITNVEVLNAVPIEMKFTRGKIDLTSTDVSAIPIQLKVTTIQNGESVTFYRSVVATADGRLLEHLYEPMEFFGLQHSQYVVDLEGADLTEISDFVYVHGDFEGAKIPILHDYTEIAKYGEVSDVGRPSEIGQHVMILIPNYGTVIWQQVTDDKYYVDEVPIPAEFSKVYAVEKLNESDNVKGSFYAGMTDTHIQFGRHFFDNLYKIGGAKFFISGLNENSEFIKKQYELRFSSFNVSFTEIGTAEIIERDHIVQWFNEGDVEKFAQWLDKTYTSTYENLSEWANATEQERLVFSAYMMDKYQQQPIPENLLVWLDFESLIGQAKRVNTIVMNEPYGLYYNYVLSQLLARISHTDELLYVTNDYNKLIDKVNTMNRFNVIDASARWLQIDPSLNDWYEHQQIVIEQNGKNMKAEMYADYPYGLYFDIIQGHIISGHLTVTTTDRWGEEVKVNQDVIVRPAIETQKDLGNNKVKITYTDTIEFSEEFSFTVRLKNAETLDLHPTNKQIEDKRHLILTLTDTDYKKYVQSEDSYVNGLMHRYNGQLVETY